MPPATYRSPSPARIAWAASMTALRPEPETLLTVVAGTLGGRPPRTATIGPIIPPSIPMVFIAVISDLSIGRLFLGGVVPGLLMGAFLAVTIYLQSLRHSLPTTPLAGGLTEFLRLLGQALLALLAPLIILAGVVFGVVTR